MTDSIRGLSSVAELELLRPVLLEYFRFISAQLRDNHGGDLDPSAPVRALFRAPDAYLPPKGQTLVAERDDEILGTVALKSLDDDRVEIKRLYVRPGAQGLGLGRSLLTAAKARAREIGARQMCLDTLGSLEAAKAMYLSDGFEMTAQYPGAAVGEDPDILPHAIFMRCAL